MTNLQDVTKFEFLLTLEGNIICQRFFNVKNHNPKSKKSLDIHDYVKDICEEISHDLKIKTLDYLTENQDNSYGLKAAAPSENDEKEYFLLEIKLKLQ
jgi:hypothetical protein